MIQNIQLFKPLGYTIAFFLGFTSLGFQVYGQNTSLAYQTILEDKNGDKIKNVEVEILIELRQLTANGNIAYSEEHLLTTGINGEVQLYIGEGDPLVSSYDEVDWSVPIYTSMSFRPSGFVSYIDGHTSQLLSVPYAMFSFHTKCEEGCPGEDGPQGPRGYQGPSGPQGSQAAPAGVGPDGPAGPAGVFGLTMTDRIPYTSQSVEHQVYLDDGTNRTDGKPGLRQFFNNQWNDL